MKAKSSPGLDKQITSLYATGMTQGAIGHQLGLGRSVVFRRLRALGIAHRKSGPALRSPEQFAADFWARVLKTDTCWLWQGLRNEHGYGLATVSHGRNKLAHRLSWSMANGSIANGLLVCHRCDVPACVRPDHLFLGDSRDNIRDSCKKGRKANKFGPQKLSTERVADIRASYVKGKGKTLAEKHGVTVGTILDVVSGRTWSYV